MSPTLAPKKRSSPSWLSYIGGGIAVFSLLITGISNYTGVAKTATEDHKVVTEHVANTAIHIDPARDGLRWEELFKRLGKIEDKLDKASETKTRTVYVPTPVPRKASPALVRVQTRKPKYSKDVVGGVKKLIDKIN